MSQDNGHPRRLQVPGEVQVGVVCQPGPLAQPVSLTLTRPGAAELLVVGGISTRLQIAAQFMGGELANMMLGQGAIDAQLPINALRAADALIAADRDNPPQAPEPPASPIEA